MSETKHTPGPWFNWDEDVMDWIHEPSKLLANYPDACLIAAAPELLRALEEMRRVYGNCDGLTEADKIVHEAARLAIAKAKGDPV